MNRRARCSWFGPRRLRRLGTRTISHPSCGPSWGRRWRSRPTMWPRTQAAAPRAAQDLPALDSRPPAGRSSSVQRVLDRRTVCGQSSRAPRGRASGGVRRESLSSYRQSCGVGRCPGAGPSTVVLARPDGCARATGAFVAATLSRDVSPRRVDRALAGRRRGSRGRRREPDVSEDHGCQRRGVDGERRNRRRAPTGRGWCPVGVA